MKLLKIYILAVIMTAINLNAQTHGSLSLADSIPLSPSVRYGVLNNGFTYYLDSTSTTKGQIDMKLIVRAGTFQEGKDQRGYAHLLEHMGGKSTKNFPDIHDYFRSRGGYTHATIGMEKTEYLVRIPAEDRKLLADALEQFKDLTSNISLEQSSIDTERGAVLGEGRGANPHMWWENQVVLFNQSFRNTKYNAKLYDSKNPAVRYEKIRNFDRDSFIRYYKDYYRPDLQALVVVGDVGVDSLETLIREVFSGLSPTENKRDVEGIDSNLLQLSGKNQYDQVVDTNDTELRLVMTSKNITYGHHNIVGRSDYERLLVQELYKSILRERSKDLTDQYEPIISRLAFLDDDNMERIRLTISFDRDSMEKKMIGALKLWKALHHGFTDTELQKAKREILEGYTNASRDNSSLSKRYIDHFVAHIAAPGKERELEIVSNVLEDIELESVQSYANKGDDLMSNKDFMFFHGPQDQIPDFAKVRDWVRRANSAKIPPIDYKKNKITDLHGLPKLPVIDMEDLENSQNEIGVTTIVLPNDIKILLKPSDTTSGRFANIVHILGFRSPGLPYRRNPDFAVEKMAPEVVMYAGAGDYDKFQLEDFMAERKLTLRMNVNVRSQEVIGSAHVNHLQDWFDLLQLYVMAPREDEVALSAWKKKKASVINGTWGRGSSDFYKDSLEQVRFEAWPSISLADIENLNMPAVIQAFSKYFSNYQGYTFIITGDFKTAPLLDMLVPNIIALPATRKKLSKSKELPAFNLEKINETIALPNMEENIVHLSFPFEVKPNLKKQIILGLLAEAIKHHIYEQLREGTYYPNAYGEWVDWSNNIYAFNITFDTELGEERKMINYARKKFIELRENGVDKEWLESTITNKISAFNRRLKKPVGFSDFWQSYIKKKIDRGEDMTKEVLEYEPLLKHFISVEDVNRVAKEVLTEAYLQQVLIVPTGYNIGTFLK